MDNNDNYIDKLCKEHEKYNQCQNEFETYFASLEYENAKDLKLFTTQLAEIKELLPGNAVKILKGDRFEGGTKPRWFNV